MYIKFNHTSYDICPKHFMYRSTLYIPSTITVKQTLQVEMQLLQRKVKD